MRQMFRVVWTCLALLTASLVCYGSAQGILVSGTVTGEIDVRKEVG